MLAPLAPIAHQLIALTTFVAPTALLATPAQATLTATATFVIQAPVAPSPGKKAAHAR